MAKIAKLREEMAWRKGTWKDLDTSWRAPAATVAFCRVLGFKTLGTG
jgi:hypothetical protein